MTPTTRKKRSDAGRKRTTTVDEICDRFAALPADGRDGLLITLQQIDRVLRKRDREAALSNELDNSHFELELHIPRQGSRVEDDEGPDELDNPNFELERCPPRE